MRPFIPISRQRPGPPLKGATPSKGILRQPSVLGRRTSEHAGLDSSDPIDAPESPTKRRKVFFDDIQNSVHEFGNRSMDEVRMEVRKALEDHLAGDAEGYDALKEIFANDKQRYLPPIAGEEEDTLKPQELTGYVVALTSCVPLLKDKACSGLVKTVLKVSWLGRDMDFLHAYIQFLAALISTQGSYLSSVLSMIIQKFFESRGSEWKVPDFPAIKRDAMRERLHTSLRYLLKVFPAVTPVLRQLLVSKFPYSDESKRIHVAYVNNLITLKSYAPDLDVDITNLIIDRLVNIDVQMQVDLEDLDDDIAASVTYALGSSTRDDSWEGDEDASDEDTDDESVASDDTDFDEKEEKIRVVKGNVEKMDSILDTLFELYTPHFDNPDSDEAKDQYRVLLNSFTNIILPTHKSRHTQFLMFHFGQLSAGLRDLFVGTCIGVATESSRPTFMRQAASTYLAGFIARGAHVPAEIVRTVFQILLRKAEFFRKKHEADARGPDLKRYQMYYAHMQAVLYMFCFRWRDLVVSAPEFVDHDDPASYLGHELEWLDGLYKSLHENIYSKLNPLKVCAPAIVEEFATLAHKLNLMYIFPRLESNKRIRLSQFVSDTYATGGALRDAGTDGQNEEYYQLDPYFPFDPYQLPVSKRWLEGDYVRWEAVPGLNMDVEDEDSDDAEMDQDDEVGEEDTATDSENGEDN